MLSRQNPLTLPPPPPHELPDPPGNLINPTTRNQNPRNGINQPNHQAHEPRPLLADQQQDWLNVVLEEDARNHVGTLGDRAGLAGGRVLVCEDGVVGVEGVWGGGVDGVGVEGGTAFCVKGWYDGEEVLEFVVVVGCFGDGFIERVEETGVVWAEGEFGDHVGEVECCIAL